MRKLFLLLLLVPLFSSCSKGDDSPLTISDSQVTLNYQGTYQINATSESSISYVSEDEFHAAVSISGLVTANKVGETNIAVSDGKSVKKLKVTVTPKSTLYEEPLTDWTLTKAQIISKLGTPTATTDTGIGYAVSNTKAPAIVYLFDSNNVLKYSSTQVKVSYAQELTAFLLERYVYATTDGSIYAFLNGLSLSKSSTMVGLSVYNTSYYQVSYIPTSTTKSVSTDNGINLNSSGKLFDKMIRK